MSPQALQEAYRALTSGRPEKTLKMLAASPSSLPVLLLRGGAFASLGRNSEAIAAFEEVLKLKPDQLEAAYNLAICQQSMGRFQAARKNLDLVLEKQPNNLQAMLALNSVLAEMGYQEERERLLSRALELSPSDHRFRHSLGCLYHDMKRFEEAEEIARSLVGERPNDLPVLTLLGDVCVSRGVRQGHRPLIEEAVSLFERVYKADSHSKASRLNLGNALNALHDPARAVPLFRELVRDYPQDASSHYGLGLALKDELSAEEARQCFERTVELDPEHGDAQHMLAVVALASEDFETGSRKYEWRWRISNPLKWRQRDLPLWNGESLEKGRLLVWAEQGLGDQLLHYGWLRHLDALDTSFGLECDSRLVTLLQRSYPDAIVLPVDDLSLSDLGNSEFVAQCPSGDLLLRTRPWESDKGRTGRYLQSDDRRCADFQRRLSAVHGGPKIGISWYSKGSPFALKKSRPLSEWRPILSVDGPLFVNLQYGDSEEEFEAACRANGAAGYCDTELDRKNDIEGLCALIDALDLVITVSNVTAHFAGALGKPCWVLLGADPLWHWGSQPERAPFYPSVRTFRVTETNGWGDIIQDVARQLAGQTGLLSSAPMQ